MNEDLIRLAKKLGAKDYSPPPMRAVKGLSLTFEQLEKLVINILLDTRTDMFHPEFGTEWREPDGELYKAYHEGFLAGVSEGDNSPKGEHSRLRVMRELTDRWCEHFKRVSCENADLRNGRETARDAILNGRGALEAVLDSDQTNAVLSEFDDAFQAEVHLPSPDYMQNSTENNDNCVQEGQEMTKEKTVEMVLDLDTDLLEALNKIVATGILGKDLSAVVNHILREYIYTQTFCVQKVSPTDAREIFRTARAWQRELDAKELDLKKADILLMAGEMTAGEMRTVKAVLGGVRARILNPMHVVLADACPVCGGEADNGFDREYPPNPYACTKCA